MSIIDVETGDLRLVDLGTSCTFRSPDMMDHGTAAVPGTDGKLHLIDPGTATEIRTVDVVDLWEKPDEWRHPPPGPAVAGNRAYVTDPVAGNHHAAAPDGGTDPVSVDLPAMPDESSPAPSAEYPRPDRHLIFRGGARSPPVVHG